jgi:hypothetical protein
MLGPVERVEGRKRESEELIFCPQLSNCPAVRAAVINAVCANDDVTKAVFEAHASLSTFARKTIATKRSPRNGVCNTKAICCSYVSSCATKVHNMSEKHPSNNIPGHSIAQRNTLYMHYRLQFLYIAACGSTLDVDYIKTLRSEMDKCSRALPSSYSTQVGSAIKIGHRIRRGYCAGHSLR